MDKEKNKILEIFNNKILKEVVVNRASTEEELVNSLGYKYIRLPVLDNFRPDDKTVDLFLNIIKNKSNSWMHFHCHAGMGRTTSFMVMLDMFYNAKHVDFDQIIERHKVIGGHDLKNL